LATAAEAFGMYKLRVYRPGVEPVTPMMTTSQGLRWDVSSSNISTVQAGGAKTGIVSTMRAARKTRR